MKNRPFERRLPQEAYNRYTHSDNYNIRPYLLFVKREISLKIRKQKNVELLLHTDYGYLITSSGKRIQIGILNSFGGNADIEGDVTVGGDINVANNASITGDITVGKNATVNGTVTAKEFKTLGGKFSVPNIEVTQDTSLNNVSVTGNAILKKDLSIGAIHFCAVKPDAPVKGDIWFEE